MTPVLPSHDDDDDDDVHGIVGMQDGIDGTNESGAFKVKHYVVLHEVFISWLTVSCLESNVCL